MVDTQTEITAKRMDISEQTAARLLEENSRLSSLVMLPFSEHFFTKDAVASSAVALTAQTNSCF